MHEKERSPAVDDRVVYCGWIYKVLDVRPDNADAEDTWITIGSVQDNDVRTMNLVKWREGWDAGTIVNVEAYRPYGT